MSDNVIPLFKVVEPKKKRITAKEIQRLEWFALQTLQRETPHAYFYIQWYFDSIGRRDYFNYVIARIDVTEDGIYTLDDNQ